MSVNIYVAGGGISAELIERSTKLYAIHHNMFVQGISAESVYI